MPSTRVWWALFVLVAALSLGCAKTRYPRPQYPGSTVGISADLAGNPDLRQIQRQYDRIARGYADKNVDSILAVLSADYTANRLRASGDVTPIREALRRWFTWHGKPILSWYTIRSAEWTGQNTVRLQVFHQGSSIQNLSGKLRRVEDEENRYQTWCREEGVWKASYLDSLWDFRQWVDGKPTDPSKRFDPDAPPFVPGKMRD